jgi:hypothetical protein
VRYRLADVIRIEAAAEVTR